MTFLDGISASFTRLSLRSKVGALESTFQQTLEIFRELLSEVQSIQDESDKYKMELLTQKEKCYSNNCPGSEKLKKVIEIKENIIQMAASTTIRLNETRNLSIINELFKILCGEVATVTPPKDEQENKENAIKAETPVATPRKRTERTDVQANKVKKRLLTPKKECNSSLDDVSFKEESISEIDGTPGPTSPIISRKFKSSSSISVSGTSTDSRDKKKCPDNWPTSDPKQLKLCFPPSFGKGKSRQGKLVFTAADTGNVVDLTCSPEFSGGARNTQNCQSPHVQLLIKKESSDNDDTILPSPTSGPTNVALSKTSCNKDSQNQKFRKPLPLSLVKKEKEVPDDASSPIISVVDKKPKESITTKCEELEDSINILQPNRFQKSPYKLIPKQSPIKRESSVIKPEPGQVKLEQAQTTSGQEDITHCDEASMSILQHLNKLDGNTRMNVDADAQKSTIKRPLTENRNAVNIPPVAAHESSTSLSRPEVNHEDHSKRKHIATVEPVYKEPTVRKKAEKMRLPAWCCDECIDFFGNLYEDDPDMVKKIIGRCSKHRGRNNPARPKTPPGFWNPRWDVPEDTEEFNKRNNAS